MTRLLLVGNPQEAHVGRHLLRGAEELGIEARLLDVREASASSAWWRRLNWHVLGRRPPRLAAFSRSVADACASWRPDVLLTTGAAPVTAEDLRALPGSPIRVNFSTDDPWNPAVRARWLLEALPAYDWVFTPRPHTVAEFRALGVRNVGTARFGFAPDVHAPGVADGPGAELLFFGGADPDRVPFLRSLANAGLGLELYGGYWERDPVLRSYARGVASLATLRSRVAAARMVLCLVRRANRDQHVMRTFEVPAMMGCMLAEDSPDHRVLFGEHGERVLYFRSPAEVVRLVRETRDSERTRLAQAAHEAVTRGGHTYASRLRAILATVGRA